MADEHTSIPQRVHRTTSVDDAHQIGERLFHPHRLTPRTASGDFSFTANSIDIGDVAIGSLRYRTAVRVDTPPYASWYQLNVTTTGTLRTLVGERLVEVTPSRAAVYGPDVDTAFSGFERPTVMIAIKLKRDVVERRARDLLPAEMSRDDPVALSPTLDVAHGAGCTWLALARRVAEATRRHGPLDERVAAHYSDRLVTGLVVCGMQEQLARAARAGDLPVISPETAIDRAREAIEAAHGAPLGLETLATLSGVTGRALQQAFRQAHDMTPMQFQLGVRLDRVRAELAVATPATASVADVATRHGFAHLGRFAGSYAARFGERPSETLRR